MLCPVSMEKVNSNVKYEYESYEDETLEWSI